jgi:long-chain fatty acid transport protein
MRAPSARQRRQAPPYAARQCNRMTTGAATRAIRSANGRFSNAARIAAATLALATATLAAPPCAAGGFYLQEQSPKSTGRANAGEAAAADGPETILFNPAGMTELEGTWVAAGVHLLDVKAAQADAGSRRSVPGGGVIPVGGGDGGNPFNNPVPVPNGYASIQIDDRLWAGLAINAPFGLVVEYDDNFFGRYDSLRSELFTLNVQPSVAYKFSDSLSVGVGVNFQYVDAELTSALPQVSPLLTDGRSRLAGDALLTKAVGPGSACITAAASITSYAGP